MAALNHPNIVTIYSVEEAGGLDFLTMELLEARPLMDFGSDYSFFVLISPFGMMAKFAINDILIVTAEDATYANPKHQPDGRAGCLCRKAR